MEEYRSAFLGVPTHCLFEAKPTEVQPPSEPLDSDDEQPKAPPVSFLEVDRLSYVVRAIEVDCQVVPVGAFRLT